MDLGLKGKTALVAASSEGIGKACAHQFAAEGCSVICCSRDRAKVDAAVTEIRARTHHHNVVGLVADVSRAEEVIGLAQKAFDVFGSIDILVTNAGGPPTGVFDSLTDADWEAAFHLTLMSAVRLSRAFLPYMIERGWGRIVNITSISVKQPIPDLMLSNSLRAAVTGMAKTLANEVGPENITVNNVAPGYTQTERLLALFDGRAKKQGLTRDEALSRAAQDISLRRLATPDEIASVVVFLASEKASYITGATIPVDGGSLKCLY